MKAMILAAGLGERMRPLTGHTPKPLLEVRGRPLIEHHLTKLAQAGVSEAVVNLAHLGEQIRAYLGDGSRYGLQIHYSNEPEPLETGGALVHARALLGQEPFLLINGDVWCELAFEQFIQQARQQQNLGHLLLVPNPSFHPSGDFALADNGQLIPDPDKCSPNRFTFAGISLLSPALIDNYPDKRRKFPLGEVLRHAIEQNQLSAQVYRGAWSDVGTPERLAALNHSNN